MAPNDNTAIPDHWAQVDPGPITARRRDKRIAKLTTERTHILERLTAWHTSVENELIRTTDFYDGLINRERRRPTQQETPK